MDERTAVEREGNLTVLTISNPPLNLFDQAMFDALDDATTALAIDPPRGLLIRAAGKVVSAGIDVPVLEGLTPADGAEFWRRLLRIAKRVEDLPCPVVFAAHGLTLTAAFELALACDIIVAGRSAKFGLVETVLALTPSMGGPQRIAERAGSGRARELVMTAELFDAETLERWNVINRVWEDEDVTDKSISLALGLADGPTQAHAATKTIIQKWSIEGLTRADDAVAEVSGALFGTQDFQDAFAGFRERGPRHTTPMNGR